MCRIYSNNVRLCTINDPEFLFQIIKVFLLYIVLNERRQKSLKVDHSRVHKLSLS